MPIYEYRCRACGRTSTFITLSVSETLVPKCSTCGGLDLEKLVSRVAVIRSAESRADSLGEDFDPGIDDAADDGFDGDDGLAGRADAEDAGGGPDEE